MQPTHVFAIAFSFALGAAASAPSLPRGESPFQYPLNALLERDPQTFCDGINCGAFCVPIGYHCCSDGGAGCPYGSNCVPNGCCPVGESCAGAGGTVTFGGGGPAPTVVVSTHNAAPPAAPTYAPPSDSPSPYNPPAYTPPTFSSFSPINAFTSDDTASLASFLATAFPTTGTTSPALGAASAAAGGGFPSSPTFALPSATAVPSTGGSKSGGSSSAQAADAVRSVTRSMMLSGMGILFGLIAVQML